MDSVDVLTREVLTPDPSVPRLVRLGDLLDDLATDALAAHEAFRTGTLRGPVTGLDSLDRELGGAIPAGPHILHGGPGAGKTALGLQVAAGCGAPALYVTCEMAPLELLRRHIARVTGTPLGRLKSGELAPSAVIELARTAADAAPGLVIADATRAFAPANWLLAVAESIRGDSPALLAVIDSLHSWADGMPGDADEYARLGAALGALRGLASALDSPILVIAERNRASMKVGGLSAGAGHRRIEYGAESVWELDRKDEVAGSPGEVPVTLRLAKNRNGAPGREIALQFHGARQRFREVS